MRAAEEVSFADEEVVAVFTALRFDLGGRLRPVDGEG